MLIRTLPTDTYGAIVAFKLARSGIEERRLCAEHSHLTDFPQKDFLHMFIKLDPADPTAYFCVKDV